MRNKYGSQPEALYIPDPRLGHRPNPAYADHDVHGWRNADVLLQADIVALGDSQTYGLNVDKRSAWPQRLSDMLGKSVYQIAFGGYGPAHYAQLIEDALALKPATIVVGYYYGNDILDSYWQVYNVKQDAVKIIEYSDVLSQFKSVDSHVLDDLQRAEIIDPRHMRHAYMDCQSPRFVPNPDLQRVEGVMELDPLDKLTPQMIVTAHSVLYRTILSKYQILRTRLGLAGSRKDYGAPLCIPFSYKKLATKFSPGYRLLTLTDTDPRVIEGRRINLLAFSYMARRCEKAGVRFLVAFIPTKEFVFRKFSDDRLAKAQYMLRLWKLEEEIRNETKEFLESQGISYVDTLPGLEKMIAEERNPYKQAVNNPRIDADGHPVKEGYESIAKSIAEYINRSDSH